MKIKYSIYAYYTQEKMGMGSVYDTWEDTLSEAKKRAKYCLTKDFSVNSEMSTPLGYCQVINNETRECVFDCFAK